MSATRASTAFLFLYTLTSLSAFADLKPIDAKSKAAGYANTANGIFSVKQVHSGKFSYKLVTMESLLNGDVGNTSILLTGTEVGGEAGYESAFLLSPKTPKSDILSASDIVATSTGVEITAHKAGGGMATRSLRYDAKKKILKEGKLIDLVDCASKTDLYEQRQCLNDEYSKADKALNSAYTKLKSKMDSIGSGKLVAAQKAWIAYRDAECDLIGDGERGGQLENILSQDCLIRMTKEQTAALLGDNRA